MTFSQTEGDRVLAIDVRPSRFGFCVFEGPGGLLDCGTRKIRSVTLGTAKARILIRAFAPSVLVLRKIRQRSSRNRPLTRALQRRICHLAQGSRIPVVFVAEHELRRYFLDRGARTKHQIATYLAGQFAELEWKLPKKRKPYEREPWSLIVFDAAALAVTYLAKDNERVERETQEAN